MEYIAFAALALCVGAFILTVYLAWSKLMATVQQGTDAANALVASVTALKTSVDALVAKPPAPPVEVVPDAIVQSMTDATTAIGAIAAEAQTAAAS